MACRRENDSWAVERRKTRRLHRRKRRELTTSEGKREIEFVSAGGETCPFSPPAGKNFSPAAEREGIQGNHRLVRRHVERREKGEKMV